MSDKENRSIAYIYHDMDPSEELEFERDLSCDSNLLIEVESLKKIAGKIKKLKPVEPPAEVVEAVHKKLADTRSDNGFISGKFIWYSAAAAMLMFVTAGLYLIESGDSPADEGTGTAVVGGNSYVYPTSVERTSDENVTDKISPWIDRNEVIRFQDGIFTGEEPAAIDSIYRQSFQKLTPVTNPSQSATARQNLHLTGNR